ncbi:hypothetical protein H1164_03755 [Thermoactinomyces daqus]|uniref:Uncharacterized protein n=1 Tax=Thermoactinomyces daqus TaxID=1329516 RepID=A0A7W1X8G1_9BACL|nr:hypothetical protein [Thermoactinomyces daqus]MBA4542016.1 hypothetical protein [Thermoactinomyces daqus]
MDMHIYKPSRERLRAARERLNQRDKTRGTPEERMRHQLEVYLDMKEFQDRVYGYIQALLNAHIEEEE